MVLHLVHQYNLCCCSIDYKLIYNWDSQPVAATVIRGNTASYTVATFAAPSPTYQWQRSATAGGTYVNVADATPVGVTYTGANSATLNVITQLLLLLVQLITIVVLYHLQLVVQ